MMHRNLAGRVVAGAALASALLSSSASYAQAIVIAPVTVALRPGELTTTVTVTNRGSSTTAVQVRPFAWDQPAGQERLEPTRDLLVSPPISKIAPGQTQTVRILLKRPATSKEETYRIFFDNIPADVPANGVRVALRISVPVFGAPVKAIKSDLAWQAFPEANGDAELSISNRGSRHAHLSRVRVALPDGSQVAAQDGTSVYVLAGATMRIHVTAKGHTLTPGASLRVMAGSDEGEIVASVPILYRR